MLPMCFMRLRPLYLPLLLWSLSHLRRTNAYINPFTSFNAYHNGPWPFIGCTQEEGLALQNLWAEVGHFIDDPIVRDTRLGQQSKHGYSSMFSSNSPGDIEQVFHDITNRKSTFNPGKTDADSLLIVCVNPGEYDYSEVGESMKQAQQYCAGATSQGRTQIFLTMPGLDIYICPGFWSLYPNDFPSGDQLDCPTMADGNKFFEPRGREPPITKHKLAKVVYQLSRKYAPSVVPAEGKLWGLNECFGADPNIQKNNGMNYAYYASCTSKYPGKIFHEVPSCFNMLHLLTSPSYIVVLPGCTNFPASPRLGGKSRRSYPLPNTKRQQQGGGDASTLTDGDWEIEQDDIHDPTFQAAALKLHDAWINLQQVGTVDGNSTATF